MQHAKSRDQRSGCGKREAPAYPKLDTGAIIVADNLIRPENEDVKRYGGAVRATRHRPGRTLRPASFTRRP